MRTLRLIPLVALLAGGCSEESTTPSATTEEFDLPADQVAWDISQNLTTDGIRTATLVADTALIYERERRMDLMGVNVVFYNEAGGEAGHLTSDKGDYNMETRAFVARGNVVLRTQTPAGDRLLETEELNYETQVDSLYTTRPFKMTENGRVSSGTSFNTNSKFTTWRVTGVQTETPVEGDAGLSF